MPDEQTGATPENADDRRPERKPIIVRVPAPGVPPRANAETRETSETSQASEPEPQPEKPKLVPLSELHGERAKRRDCQAKLNGIEAAHAEEIAALRESHTEESAGLRAMVEHYKQELAECRKDLAPRLCAIEQRLNIIPAPAPPERKVEDEAPRHERLPFMAWINNSWRKRGQSEDTQINLWHL